jgi:carotenoid cleavage dioxygenase-like enzyme
MRTAVDAATYKTPVTEEIDALDLPVDGALPPELCGDYIRNGPNLRPGAAPSHSFLGDGMLHGIRLEGGRARAYRNRWVRTRAFVEHASYLRLNGTLDLTVAVANTNIVAHGNRLLALVESSYPTDVTRTLETGGPYDFAGRLKTPFAAHPKVCPRTGELHAFGMMIRPAGLTYHRVDAAGTLVESRPIPVRGVTMMHDFALTDRHAVFMDLPVVFDMVRALRGKMPYRWDAKYGARLGIVKRDDATPVQWIDVEPCYVFHVANAFEDGETIVMDVVRYDDLWRTDASVFGPTTLRRWTIDTRAGSVKESILDERSCEFPRCDERRSGNPYRYAYAVAVGATGEGSAELRKFDLATGTTTQHDFGPGRVPGEAVFVPAASGEDAGWLMCYVYDAARDRSDFVVLDASDVAAKPVATVPLPVRVPLGFHGNWIPAAALTG